MKCFLYHRDQFDKRAGATNTLGLPGFALAGFQKWLRQRNSSLPEGCHRVIPVGAVLG